MIILLNEKCLLLRRKRLNLIRYGESSCEIPFRPENSNFVNLIEKSILIFERNKLCRKYSNGIFKLHFLISGLPFIVYEKKKFSRSQNIAPQMKNACIFIRWCLTNVQIRHFSGIPFFCNSEMDFQACYINKSTKVRLRLVASAYTNILLP